MSGLASAWVIRDPSRVNWFAEALREVMAERAMSVGVLARKLETSPSLVRKWRAGTSVPSVERAAEIADAVGVPYEKLCLPTSRGAGVVHVERREDPDVGLRRLAERDTLPLGTDDRESATP